MKEHPDWWDPWSCQPCIVPKADKRRISAANVREYARVLLTAIALSGGVAWQYNRLRKRRNKDMADFAGLGIHSEPQWQNAHTEMVEELGVKHLLLRIPVWRPDQFEHDLRFLERFETNRFVINILQDRQSVLDPDLWQSRLHQIFDAFSGRCNIFKIGNAVNRSKWGCRNTGDALRLFKIADDVRADYPHIRLLGSSIIDFEPLPMQRTLFNLWRYNMDGCAALLYVNRRGSAHGKQYRYFNLERKIRLNKAMLKLSNTTRDELWITETNWPLLDTWPWTPNSGHPATTVDETTQANYLKQYFSISLDTGWVERVYWWQLINPGYGLVDHRQGSLRKMPSYHAFKSLLKDDPRETHVRVHAGFD